MREIVSPLSGIRSPFGQRREVSLLALYAANGLNPSLVIDAKTPRYFLDGVQSDLVSVTDHSRASSATYLDSNGALQTAASGVLRDQAYTYVDGVLTGPYVLTEPAATNLVTHSADIANAAWHKVVGGTGATPVITSNYAVAPSGDTTADRVIFNAGAGTTTNDFSVVLDPITLSSGVTYTQSVWLSATSGTQRIYVYTSGAAFGNVLSGEIVELTAGDWVRVSQTRTASASGTGNMLSIGLFGADGITETTADILIWGGQVEASSVPTSYIPTSGSQGARAADVLTIPDAPWPATVEATGTELVTNGTFDTDSDWILGPGVTISGGTLNFSGSPNNTLQSAVVSGQGGKLLYVEYEITSYTSGYVEIFAQQVSPTVITNRAARGFSTGVKSGYLVVPDNASFFGFTTNNFVGSIDNISVKEISPRGLAIAMDGLMTYADTDSTNTSVFFSWFLDGSNEIKDALWTNSTNTGAVVFEQRQAGVLGRIGQNPPGSYFPGVNVPFSIASYHKDNGINGAVDGVSLTENTTPTILPDLSATPITIRAAGGPLYIEEMRIWVEGAVDKITDALIEEVS